MLNTRGCKRDFILYRQARANSNLVSSVNISRVNTAPTVFNTDCNTYLNGQELPHKLAQAHFHQLQSQH